MNATEHAIAVQGGASDRRGVERATEPLISEGITPLGSFTGAGALQVGPSAARPANEEQGHGASNRGSADIGRRFHAPSFIRRMIQPSAFEDPKDKRLTGSPTPGSRGQLIEPVRPYPTDQIGAAADEAPQAYERPQPVVNGQPGQPNMGELIEEAHGEPFIELRAVRANFPFLPIAQFPSHSVTKALVQDDVVELALPEGAVICRISWQTGTDIAVSLHGNPNLPTAADNKSAQEVGIQFEGTILNPDPQTWYYCKGIKTISAMTPTAAGSWICLQAYCGSYNVNPRQRES